MPSYKQSVKLLYRKRNVYAPNEEPQSFMCVMYEMEVAKCGKLHHIY